MDDNILVERAAHGDQDAFALLFEQYRRYVYAIAYRITFNEDDALDVTQIVFTRLIEKIGHYRGTGAFRSWLATIASREATNFNRQRYHRHETAIDPEEFESMVVPKMYGNNPGLTTVLDLQEKRRLVNEAMNTLSPQQRAIMLLRLDEGMGPTEIAACLDMPCQQVRSQTFRAIAKIRKMLPPEVFT